MNAAAHMEPIALTPDVEVKTPADLVSVIIKATDARSSPPSRSATRRRSSASPPTASTTTGWPGGAPRSETPVFDPELANHKVKASICRRRGYDPDDFASVLQATKERARLPFGWTALDLALSHHRKQPFRLLHPDVAGARLPTAIGALAYPAPEARGRQEHPCTDRTTPDSL